MTGFRVTSATRSGEFVYHFDDYDEARAAVEKHLLAEQRSRPRQRKIGYGRWLLDHPRQRAIYPNTVSIERER